MGYGIRKLGDRAVTRTLNREHAERHRPMFDNARRLRQLFSELETPTAQQVELSEGWT